jgi:hypothetical protein
MRYDPDAPEGSKPRGSQYISKKDVIRVGVVLVVLGIFLAPVYKKLKKDGQRKICTSNFKAISGALFVYAANHDDRLPPNFLPDATGSPLMENGVPFTWASSIDGLMSSRAAMGCALATPEEHCTIVSTLPGGKRQLAYGMYAGLGGKPISHLKALDNTVLLAATSNHGAGNSYNPVHIGLGTGGVLENDGFLIGWDNSPWGNSAPDDSARYVTRLAVRNASGGDFVTNAQTRHSIGLAVILASGGMTHVSPEAARIAWSGDRITGNWQLD